MSDPQHFIKLEVLKIKGVNLRTTTSSEQHGAFIQFTLADNQIQKTKIIKDSKNGEWNDDEKLYIQLEDEIKVDLISQDEVIGNGQIKVYELTNGKHQLKIDLKHDGKSAGQLLLDVNVTKNNSYSSSTGIKGKLIISNVKAEFNKDNNHQLQTIFALEGINKNTSFVSNNSNKSTWNNNTIIFPVKNDTELRVKVISKENEELGNGQTNFRVLVDKEGIFPNEKIELFEQNNASGSLFTNLEFRPLEYGEDKQEYDLKRIMGKVKISNMKAVLDRELEQNDKKIETYCNIQFHDIQNKTQSQQNVEQTTVNWTEQNTFNLFTYQKNSLVIIDIHDKNIESNEDNIIGRVTIELSHFLEEIGEHPKQEVEIQFKQRFAGTFYYTATSELSNELKTYQEKKQSEQAAAIKKKQEDDEKQAAQKKQQDEEQALKKKKDEEDAAQQTKKNQENQDDEEKKKKQQQEQEEKNKKEQEEKQTEQNNITNTNINESEKNTNNNNKSMLSQEELGSQKKLNDKSIINDSKISKISSRKDDYIQAKKNLKNGFGLSEYQSAHTLQTSILSASFPKSLRFSQNLSEKNNSSYLVLPSSFDLKNSKGPSFGCGIRGLGNPSTNPGPGTYEHLSTQKKGIFKGYVFGESRENCKNSLSSVRGGNESKYQMKEGINFSSGLKLPSINVKQPIFTNVAKPNYHYLKGSQSVSSIRQ